MAISGFFVCRSLNPTNTFLPEQIGQPSPMVLFDICASHSCPLLHNHHTFFLLLFVTSRGVKLPFFIGCHSNAKSGLTVARSLYPIKI